jgi:hypothetical protein
VKPFKCTQCTECYRTPHEQRRHEISVHQVSTSKACTQCLRVKCARARTHGVAECDRLSFSKSTTTSRTNTRSTALPMINILHS